MSTTDPRNVSQPPPAPMAAPSQPDLRSRDGDTLHVETRKVRETKPSFATTEFWAMVAGIAALVVLYNTSDEGSLDLFRACLLGAILGGAYIVSRGLAKSGSQKRWEHLPSDDR